MRQIPSKYILLFGLFAMIPLIVGLMIFSVFLSGEAHGIPEDFAVDNEQRIYLSYNSGVFVVDHEQFFAIWPPERSGGALSISEDDMLTIANAADVRVVDLTRSDLKSGRLEIIESYYAPGNVLYSIGIEQHQTDPQNGVNYRYKGSFFYYEIFREDSSGSHLFFAMPHSDYVWNIAAVICFILYFLYLGSGFLIIYRYAKKHPEIWGKFTWTCSFKVRNKG